MSTSTQQSTLVARSGGRTSGETGAYPADLSLGVTYARDDAYATLAQMTYLRDQGSASLRDAESILRDLEHGQDALLLSSGMAASVAVFQALPAGSRVVVPEIMYFGLTRWLREFGGVQGLDVVEVPNGDLDALRDAVNAAPTALVWLETPANPTWLVADVAASAEIAHDAGAVVAVDNTVATPVHTQPLELGADLVMHSCTKYLNGHDDVVAGALVTADSDAPLWQRIRLQRQLGGAVPDAWSTYLLVRGLRTLVARMRWASASALTIAEHFADHPAIERVAYPGLATDPGHAVAARQMRGGFSGMLSLFVRGDVEPSLGVARGTRLFLRATSLGGTASLVEHRFTFEGPRSRSPRNMLRLSIGLEDPADLVADLEQAIEGARVR
ncbi:PLP-dependent aspartate aminotransferase family protein [Cellulomonas sp. HZM]|uniref:trans-sulfuration enzyme family protein n=1 Tax=Cellulomonas sp. HZM TaxID=1454010 RepID=UPI0004933BE3|nr:aminotransferase class I/II-fold pyridoxal phosphate-dependent enzyme [Cellulomonas sp. HZM]